MGKAKAKKTSLSGDQRQEILDAFNLFDKEKSGKMQTKDMKTAMRALGFEPKKEDVAKLLKGVEGSEVTCEQFITLMADRVLEKKASEEIKKAFKLFDTDKTGKISLENLRRVAEELGENVADEELLEMIEEADLDKDGAVNESEFFRIMKKTSLY